ncbi:hypothetical protein J2S13_001154 [Oikeobacillus pervagus]|uniref:Uncharacterized protein n=1 Tax=Oikeobacillus pervagus TaxID=1325931 RepID=A0AAJ1WG82_9BACI|nr:hypothetical protein [Oikeobacillus pervagus]MDQ0214757.1 hypothetical protein [Oikeobacillus pervagus]
MDGVIFGLFALSAVFFFGMFHYIFALYRPGIYPPKNILKKRAGFLGMSGLVTFLIGVLLTVMT